MVAAAADPVVLDLPFRGRWLVQNSPAGRVPSHGTDRYGITYAIDFVAVDDRDRSAPRSWRSLFALEPPELFVGFGVPVLAPVAGTVVLVHDAEADHEARRSAPALLAYALTQAGRVREGLAAIAGNHVTIALSPTGPYVTLVHLRRGSVRVRPGQQLASGEQLGECGNSGNSTEPHVHLQVHDSVDWEHTRGLPMVFRRPSAAGAHVSGRPGSGPPGSGPPGSSDATDRPTAGDAGTWMPQEHEIVDAG